MKLINNSLNDPARFRLKVLEHYYQYGWRSATDAFQVGRSTLFDWKKIFEKSGKTPRSLIPTSTRPKRVRVMATDWKLVEFIRVMRLNYGNISKYKIKLFLDEYAGQLGLPTLSVSVIGKIIKRKSFFFTGKRKIKRAKPLSPRLKRSPQVSQPGYLEMDTITIYVSGERFYYITVIDVVSKFAWCRLTTSHSSETSLMALQDFLERYQYPVRVIQTDNGSEFLGRFDEYLRKKGIEHLFSYPRSPKVNGVVERFNRTIQEEFINRYDDVYNDIEKLQEKLSHYLTWYNHKRPHHALKLRTPVDYLNQFKQASSIPKCT